MKRAFTLIELLIVIAIIAILALIAIPNFLEAQMRSKVSRCYADMRSIGTAIEAYMVDHNRLPLSMNSVRLAECMNPVMSGSDRQRNIWAQSRLTTPVAYMSSILLNPFPLDKASFASMNYGDYYVYCDFPTPCILVYGQRAALTWPRMVAERGIKWSLHSVGPSRFADDYFWNAMSGQTGNVSIYDPTNGVMSYGYITRTNKGELSMGDYRK